MMNDHRKSLFAFQSNYSLLESAISIEAAISFAQEQEITNVVLADVHVLSGMVEFYQKAKNAGLLPHIGMQVRLDGLKFLIIAKTNKGLDSLIALSAYINQKTFDSEQLTRFLTDVILVIEDATDDFLQASKQRPGVDCYIQSNSQLAKHASDLGFALLNLPIVNCLTIEAQEVINVLHAIDTNSEITSIGLHVHREQFVAALHDYPVVLSKPTVHLDLTTMHLPAFTMDNVQDNFQFIKQLCDKGIKKRYGLQLRPAHLERLAYELDIIQTMGFIDYFLIIWDVMRFARQQDIIIGPGRGSAVGSIVAYVLGITMIDPLAYDLLFERFLNIERKSLPDIDIDIEDSRRNEIILYIREKYGAEHVANIGTFGTFGARSAIRDVAKVYGMPATKITQVIKHIKQPALTIQENIAMNAQLQQVLNQNADVAQVVRIAQAIEGYPRHTSMHAAGIILTSEPITSYVPTIEVEQGVFVTQLAMGPAEALGLLKIDFLGLRNLSIIRRISNYIMEADSRVVDFIAQIPEDDVQTFKMLTTGETTGIFQLESSGMRRVLRKFQVTTFMDIAVILSLYRPGPMQFIDEYIARKNNNKPYKVEIPVVAEILKSTYGIMVYQEQVMQIAQSVGGMTLAEADIFRRAMGKKDKALLEQQKIQFMQGAQANNIASSAAEQLFEEIMAFANYGFNKSHAIAYAKISYQMAYLKTHYPAYFMTELINSVLNNETKMYAYILEANRFGIKILPPDVQKSMAAFTVEGSHAIRMGLLAIKGLGKITIETIITNRTQKMYTGLGDFLMRNEVKAVNSANVLQLANGYAFNAFSKNQKAVHTFLQTHEEGRKFQGIAISDEIPQRMDDYTLIQRRQFEIEAFGFSLYAHPLIGYPVNVASLQNPTHKAEKYIVIIDSIKEITTKQGKKMAFIRVSDINEQAELIVFPDTYVQYQPFIQEHKIVEILMRGQRNQQGELTRNTIKVSPFLLKK